MSADTFDWTFDEAPDPHRVEQALSRALSRLTWDRMERQRIDESYAMGDLHQALQVPISGNATSTPAVTEMDMTFEHPFLHKITRTDGLRAPHISASAELKSDSPVIVQAQVAKWISDSKSLIQGVTLRVLAHAPGASSPVNFTGTLHVGFSGYAAPYHDDTEG